MEELEEPKNITINFTESDIIEMNNSLLGSNTKKVFEWIFKGIIVNITVGPDEE